MVDHQIVIIHQEKVEGRSNLSNFLGDQWVKWETCLRWVCFADEASLPQELPDNVDIYRGRDAYRFCLRIACGLNSPIVGETEVFGQFKALFRDFGYANYKYGSELRSFVESTISDAKSIRHRFLGGLGSQSYGSLARRQLKGYDEVNIIGAGALAQDVLPWLVKNAEKLQIICRSPEKGKKLLGKVQQREKVEVVDLYSEQEVELKEAVLIAAPLSASDIQEQLNLRNVEKIIDLRSDSLSDPIDAGAEVIALQDFFREIENTRSILAKRVEASENEIETMIAKRFAVEASRASGEQDHLWI